MKKTLAIVLTLVMIFGIVAFNTSAEETAKPTVTIVTNKGSAVAEGTETYFTVRFDNFSEIKGIDVEITAGAPIILGEVASSGFKGDETTANGVNYTETNNKIRFVDLLTQKNARITFAAKIAKGATTETDPVIEITGEYALDGKTFFKEKLPASGTFEIKREVAEEDKPKADNVTADAPIAITPSAGTFIPQGAVYVKDGNTYTFAKKESDGTFTAPTEGAYTYQSYTIPTNGITTFGASDDTTYPDRLRFGNYTKINSNSIENGTLVFVGEWLTLKNYYIKKGYTVEQFENAIYKDVTAKLAANKNATHVFYDIGDKRTEVYRFVQKNYMWKSKDNSVLEYTIRLQGIQPDKTYAAVAYSIANDKTVTISQDVKSVQK